MANMSYCRFNNTYLDLMDCYHNMEDEVSESEQQKRDMLISLCKRIADKYDGYVFDSDYIDYDDESEDDSTQD